MAALAAFAVTSGWWAGHLWQIYGNPIFPLRNDIFASPYLVAEPMLDGRFLPSSFSDGLLYPLWIALGRHPTTEMAYRDGRFLLLAVLGLLDLWPRRRDPGQPGISGALPPAFSPSSPWSPRSCSSRSTASAAIWSPWNS
ncbi:MAG: hypothetical protein U1E45_13050 [Geminicoccaceae bacterium]